MGYGQPGKRLAIPRRAKKLLEKAEGVLVFENIKAEAMNYGEAAPANGAKCTGLTGI